MNKEQKNYKSHTKLFFPLVFENFDITILIDEN